MVEQQSEQQPDDEGVAGSRLRDGIGEHGCGRLVFRRVKKALADKGSMALAAKDGQRRPLHPGIGFMKGLITIQPGFDVSKPFSDDPWDEGYLGEDRLAENEPRKLRK